MLSFYKNMFTKIILIVNTSSYLTGLVIWNKLLCSVSAFPTPNGNEHIYKGRGAPE